MNWKTILLSFLMILFVHNSFAQSKKEQLANLQNKYDSLVQVSQLERLNAEKSLLKMQRKLDSLQTDLQRSQNNLNVFKNELNKCEENAELEKKRLNLLKLECEKMQKQIDSLNQAKKILSFEPEMIFVEGGTFQMGSNSGDSNEQPVHSVTLSSFNMGKYEVTQAQWKAVMGSNPSDNSGCDNCPVEQVSWNDVQQYIQKLNAQTGKNYRLPTEAEWEYAAKGGKASRGYTYSGSNDIGSVAWYYDNSGSKTHAIGTKQANELGIYDMSGNVWEWCSDWYGNYSGYSVTNPSGASSGGYRVLRGGSWFNFAYFCRTTDRIRDIPGGRCIGSGFRLVLPAVR